MGYSNYQTKITPLAAVTEFGRAVAAGIGLGTNPVSTYPPTQTLSSTPGMYKRSASSNLRGRTTKKARTGPLIQGNLELGEPSGFGGSRKAKYAGYTNSNKASNTLHSRPLIKIDYSATVTNPTTRSTKQVRVTGVKHRMIIHPNLALFYNAPPVMVRWAYIVNKHNTATPGAAIGTANFFKNPNPTDFGTQETDFNKDHSVLRLMNQQISRRSYYVLKEGSKILSHNSSTINDETDFSSQKNGYLLINDFIPLNRQVVFAGNTAGTDLYPMENNVYFVWWYTLMTQDETAANAQVNYLQEQHDHTTYFKNPKFLNL